jgi:hypothetical protein
VRRLVQHDVLLASKHFGLVNHREPDSLPFLFFLLLKVALVEILVLIELLHDILFSNFFVFALALLLLAILAIIIAYLILLALEYDLYFVIQSYLIQVDILILIVLTFQVSSQRWSRVIHLLHLLDSFLAQLDQVSAPIALVLWGQMMLVEILILGSCFISLNYYIQKIDHWVLDRL